MKINKYLDFNMFGYKNSIVQNDLKEITSIPLELEEFDNKTILITGANGMIATYLVYSFMYLVINKGFHINIIALSRTREKAIHLFHEFLNHPYFSLLIQDVCQPIDYSGKIDYIYHFAGNASPYYIKNDPVGIMKSNILGTFNILEFAKNKLVKKVIFASTREVYGENKYEDSLTENSFGSLNPMEPRSCYPESKRAAETILESYYLQYQINFNSVRIAHSYGPGMKLNNDGRVMADILSFVVNDQDIILKSNGEALRAFCYINDVITGLFYITLKGEDAQAYNLANETEEISIKNLSELLISISGKDIKLQFDIAEKEDFTYCNYKRVGLNTKKIESLGWKPMVILKEGLKRIIKYFN